MYHSCRLELQGNGCNTGRLAGELLEQRGIGGGGEQEEEEKKEDGGAGSQANPTTFDDKKSFQKSLSCPISVQNQEILFRMESRQEASIVAEVPHR